MDGIEFSRTISGFGFVAVVGMMWTMGVKTGVCCRKDRNREKGERRSKKMKQNAERGTYKMGDLCVALGEGEMEEKIVQTAVLFPSLMCSASYCERQHRRRAQ